MPGSVNMGASLISLEDLARLLIDRVGPILPVEVEGFSEGPIAGVTLPGGHFSTVDLSAGVESVTPAILAARAEHFLDRVQDCAVEALRYGWPSLAVDTSGSELPLAYAELDGYLLRLGYARGQDRTELEPIELCTRS